jgi:cell division septation protein DedD
VHAGTYGSETHAQKQLERLRKLDVPGYVYRQRTAAGTRIHVIAGKFVSRPEAAQLAEKLRQAGIDTYISGGK